MRKSALARESGVAWVEPGLVGEVGLGFGCFLSGRVRLFVGAVSRFNAESRVVAAHLRVSLHYCVSLGWLGWCRVWWARRSWASDGFCGLSAAGVVCCVGALCLFFPRCRPFVGADLRFSAESRVVVAHLRVSLHYCVSLGLVGWSWVWWARWCWALGVFCGAGFACLWAQICALVQFHALLWRIYA